MGAQFEYHAPGSWEEAVSLLSQTGPAAKVLAGGTDLMILIERGLIAPRHVVSLARIPEWEALTISGGVSIGAGTSYRQLERAPELRSSHTALVEASEQIGGVQVRNVATVAGNLCNASPAADSVPPLMVMEAQLLLYGPQGERWMPVDSFITGPNETALKAGELLRQIKVPTLPPHTATQFLKAGRRAAMEISIVSVAARLTMAPEGRACHTARIALGAVAPTPIRAEAAERALEGRELSTERIAAAAKLAVEAASPISDVRASADYRKTLIEHMVRRSLAGCHERIKGVGLQ